MNLSNAFGAGPATGCLVRPGEKALVVDDELTNRLVLKSLLSQIGYQVIEAGDGAAAVECFKRERPDMVFMDLVMPVLDGYEATRQLKALCGNSFVPIIVITALTDEDELAKCIETGADDVLTKPFDEVMLRSKIHAMARIRHLHLQISQLYNRMRRDEDIAEQVLSGAVTAGNVALPHVRHVVRPAGVFSGDVLLTAYGPGRDLHVLLCDFSGHGLAAALGAFPTSQLFRTMAAKGFSPREIITQINAQLYALLPREMFLAAVYVHLSAELEHVAIYNFAMPEVFVINGKNGAIKQRVASQHLPLGADSELPTSDFCQRIAIAPGDCVFLYSDGAIEARNAAGEEFGQARLEHCLAEAAGEESRVGHLIGCLDRFHAGIEQGDDVSLVEIPCVPDIFPPWQSPHLRSDAAPIPGWDLATRGSAGNGIEVALTLHGARLAQADPVPLIVGQIKAIAEGEIDFQALFTILSELYVNALDHGVLGLNSLLKETDDGIAYYFAERERRLAALGEGFVHISVLVHSAGGRGRMVIRVEDSGPGFDYSKQEAAAAVIQPEHSGRGLALVRSLCDSFRFESPGNKVEAVYIWPR